MAGAVAPSVHIPINSSASSSRLSICEGTRVYIPERDGGKVKLLTFNKRSSNCGWGREREQHR